MASDRPWWRLPFRFYMKVRGTFFDALEGVRTQYYAPSGAEERSQGAHPYAPVPIELFRRLLREVLKEFSPHAILDAGAGAGRLLILADQLHHFDRLYGTELRPEVAAQAAENLQRRGLSDRAKIVIGNSATLAVPDDADLICIYNSFSDTVLLKFFERIKESLLRCKREIRILYINTRYSDISSYPSWLTPVRSTGGILPTSILKADLSQIIQLQSDRLRPREPYQGHQPLQ